MYNENNISKIDNTSYILYFALIKIFPLLKLMIPKKNKLIKTNKAIANLLILS